MSTSLQAYTESKASATIEKVSQRMRSTLASLHHFAYSLNIVKISSLLVEKSPAPIRLVLLILPATKQS